MRARRSVEYGKDLIENPYPFEVVLLPLTVLFADSTYQRPENEAWIKETMGIYDHAQIVVVEASDRGDGTYALMDGAQRCALLRRMGYESVWCAVYTGMTIAEEAGFFYSRNKNRKGLHAYYEFNALVVKGDNRATAIQRIVTAEGFRLASGSGGHDTITAIRAVENAYGYHSEARSESLSPALHLIRRTGPDRRGATDGEVIRGLGRFFQFYWDDQIDHGALEEIMKEIGPKELVSRAKEKNPSGSRGGKSAGYEVARELVSLYNRGRKTRRLNPRVLERSRAR